MLPLPNDFPFVLNKIAKIGILSRGINILVTVATHVSDAGDLDEEAAVNAHNYGWYAGVQQAVKTQNDPHKALIGETQIRVDREALIEHAITIKGVAYGPYDFEDQDMSELQRKQSRELNRGWLNAVMAAGYTIIDIGRHDLRMADPVSCYYQMERRQINAVGHTLYLQKPVEDTGDFSFESTGCTW